MDDEDAVALIDAWQKANPGKWPDMSVILRDAAQALTCVADFGYLLSDGISNDEAHARLAKMRAEPNAQAQPRESVG